MKLIRKKVFESNSSSSHSYVQTFDEVVFDTIYPDSEGNVEIIGGQYGWEWFKTNDPLEKANYLAQNLFDKDIDLQEFINVLKEQCQCDIIIDYDRLLDGYIDHQSSGMYIYDYKNFIFNKNVWLYGGNDNPITPKQEFDVPIYTKNGIIPVVYKYSLNLIYKNCTLKTDIKFRELPTKEDVKECIGKFLADKMLSTREQEFELIDYEFISFHKYKDKYAVKENIARYRGMVNDKLLFVNASNFYYGVVVESYSQDKKDFIKNNLHRLEKYLDYEIVPIQ